MTGAWNRLLPRIEKIVDLWRAINVLHWDMEVMMPARGAATRSRSLATLETLAHERVADPELGELLDELAAQSDLTEEQRASVRILKREYDKATKVPAELVHELAEVTGNAYQAWTEAKEKSDFAVLQPHLERIVELKKQYADALGYASERYDALFDDYEPEMTTGEVESVLRELVDGLKDLIEPILAAAGPAPDWLTGASENGQRLPLSTWLAQHLGFDLEAGRVDTSPHPFTITVGPEDIRQTVRVTSPSIVENVLSTMHETGHALYDQGMPKTDLPIAGTPSMGIHESQSRLWENHVGRSRAFATFLLPHLKERFPATLRDLSPDDFYSGMNRPERSLIRTDADELTYNLHVVLRFELELALFRDELTVADLPKAWDAGMEKHVGLRPTDHATGVLQDMHWSIGYMGYFPTYSLGTLYAAAFFAKALEELGSLDEDLARGDGSRLLDWLRINIHSKGYLKPAPELARDVLGEGLSARPYLDHIRARYGELYDVNI